VSTKTAVRGFYAVVLLTALVGSTTAAAGWLGVPWPVAVVPVAAVELGGVVLSMLADDRRQLGERAVGARVLSAAVAVMAVAVNVFGHGGHVGLSAFFGGMSALGYLVYLLLSAAKRRDALRAAGKLEDTAPAYGLWQWVRHPGLTRRAARLALADTDLGVNGSLAAAREAVRTERREKAIATALTALVRKSADPVMADIAVHTYDLDQVARRIADRADYDGLTALLADDLTPAKLAGRHTGRTTDTTTAAPATTGTTEAALDQVSEPATLALPVGPSGQVGRGVHRPRLRPVTALPSRRLGRRQPVINVTVQTPTEPTRPATGTPTAGRAKPGTRPASTPEKVAAALAKRPAMTQPEVAALLGVGERTVRRYWPKPAATVNGHHHGEGDHQ
jgi:hypothetical protein